MTPIELMGYLVGVFEQIGTDYFVVGSMASSYFGDARLTNDIDVVADLSVESVGAFLKAFPSSDFYVSEDAVRAAITRRSQFNVIHPDSGLKIDVMISPLTEYDQSRMLRKTRVRPHAASFEAFFATPEDVILKKMVFFKEGGSEKHLRDIAGILKVSGDQLDHSYIELWAERLGLMDVWQMILKRIDR